MTIIDQTTKRNQRLAAEAKRLLRAAKKRAGRELKPAVGVAPLRNPPSQVFEIIEALDAGAVVLHDSAMAKGPDGNPIVVPSTVCRIGPRDKRREFHAKHLRIARIFRKQRTVYRVKQLMEKWSMSEPEARKYLNENGWQWKRHAA